MGDKQSMVIRLGRVMRYNHNRIERAKSLFDSKVRPLFDCIPFLLQLNHPEFPGFIDDPQLPYGLLFYSYNRDIQVSLLQIFPKQHEIIADLPREKLLQPSEITHCLVVVNFASHPSVTEVESVRVIYLTSWGEVFSFEAVEAFKELEQEFTGQATPPVCRLFTPERNDREALYPMIEQMTGYTFEKVGTPAPVLVAQPAIEQAKPSCPWSDTGLVAPKAALASKKQ